MLIHLLFAALALGASALTTFVIRGFARSSEIVDEPNERKIHRGPIPRFGGVAVFLSFALAMALAFDYRKWIDPTLAFSVEDYAKLMLGGTAILLLGIADDIVGVSWRWKFLVQFAVAGMMVAFGYRITAITNPFGAPFHLGLFSVPLTMLWIVGIVNALNLIDGMDGLAAGVTFISAATSFVVSYVLGNADVAIAYAVLAGASLGFLRFNFNPATIFLGDSGSLFLGFLLATLSIRGCQKSPTVIALAIPILILGLPILDTAAAFVRRSARAMIDRRIPESPSPGGFIRRLGAAFLPDRDHIHHQMLRLGLTHRQAVVCLYGVCTLLAILALIIALTSDRGLLGIVVYLSAVGIAVVTRFTRIRTAADVWSRGPARVLAVGPEDGPLAPVRDLLVRMGHQVTPVRSALEAAGTIRDSHYDVVVSDVRAGIDDLMVRLRNAPGVMRRSVVVAVDGPRIDHRDRSTPDVYDWIEVDESCAHPSSDSMPALERAVEKAYFLNRLRFFSSLLWLAAMISPVVVAFAVVLTRSILR
ncbi:MAG: hypothetical protein HYR85_21510 [Planctomycetes bacterium]|nr:hypothetical protein [Planctomycetota bacterium]MBI3845863.1 hypothetical protein [Planctomycetota bacterium]